MIGASKRCREESNESMTTLDRLIKNLEELKTKELEMGPEKRRKVEEIFNTVSREIQQNEVQGRNDCLPISVKLAFEAQ